MSETVYDITRLAGEKIDLCVRRTDDEALERCLRWINDESFNYFVGANARICQINDEKRFLEKEFRDHEYAFSIVEKKSRKHIGNCDLRIRHGSTGDLGILIGEKDCWSKGYGREAISLMRDFGFDELNLHKVSLTVLSDNPRAIKCYESCGLEICGTDREEIFHGGKYVDLIHMEMLNPAHQR